MKPKKLLIQIAKHLPTGAEIPVIVNKTDDKNVIQEYKEFMKNRKGFSLKLLQNRWDKCRENVLELLHKYQVPGHIDNNQMRSMASLASPADIAIFFEEYIFGIEKKEKLKHSKLKSKKIEALREH